MALSAPRGMTRHQFSALHRRFQGLPEAGPVGRIDRSLRSRFMPSGGGAAFRRGRSASDRGRCASFHTVSRPQARVARRSVVHVGCSARVVVVRSFAQQGRDRVTRTCEDHEHATGSSSASRSTRRATRVVVRAGRVKRAWSHRHGSIRTRTRCGSTACRWYVGSGAAARAGARSTSQVTSARIRSSSRVLRALAREGVVSRGPWRQRRPTRRCRSRRILALDALASIVPRASPACVRSTLRIGIDATPAAYRSACRRRTRSTSGWTKIEGTMVDDGGREARPGRGPTGADVDCRRSTSSGATALRVRASAGPSPRARTSRAAPTGTSRRSIPVAGRTPRRESSVDPAGCRRAGST